METKYFKYRGKPEKNFPVTSEDGELWKVHNVILGNRVVFEGTWEQCEDWNFERHIGGMVKIPNTL